MPVSRQLDILLRLKELVEGAAVAEGDAFDLAGRVFIGRTEFGEDEKVPLVSILEAPRQEGFQPAQENGLIRNTQWLLLFQGWTANDPENPTVPVYELKATVEARLARVAAMKRSGGGALHGADYLLGRRIASIIIGPGVVRPPERQVSSRAFFYLPVRVDYQEDLNAPFV